MVVARFDGAVQLYQTEAPVPWPEPGWSASPASEVAPRLSPDAVALEPDRLCALAKSSFAGAANWPSVRLKVPKSPNSPSTAILYVVPLVAANRARQLPFRTTVVSAFTAEPV